MDTMNLYPMLSFLFRRGVKMAVSLAGTHQTQICRQEWGSSEYFKVLYYLIEKYNFAHFKIGKVSRNERCQESFQYNQPFGMQGQTFIHWFLCTMYYANNNKLHTYIETSPRVWKLIFRQKQNSSWLECYRCACVETNWERLFLEQIEQKDPTDKRIWNYLYGFYTKDPHTLP